MIVGAFAVAYTEWLVLVHRVFGHPPADLFDAGLVTICRSCCTVLDREL